MSKLADCPPLFASMVFLMAALGCSSVNQPVTHVFSASPAALSFSTPAPHTTTQQTVSVQNTGTSQLVIQSVSVSGSSAFSVVKTSLPQSLQPGQSGNVVISFAPSTTGTFDGSLVIASNSSDTIAVPLAGTVGTSPITVSVTPVSASLQVGSSQQFAATISGTANTSVTWYVNGVPDGNSSYGTINSAGLYIAPASVPSGGAVTVMAKSVADATKSASVSVSIVASGAAVTVTISPTSAAVQGDMSQPFTAKVSGTSNTAVTWLVNGLNGGNNTNGTISSNGLYTAPSCPSSSSVTVTAQSAYDANASADSVVTLTPATLSSTDRYVATNGSDSNDGSACKPWATIQHAASNAQPGWTIHVGPGTYNVGNYVSTNNSGTSSKHILYVGSYDKSTWTWNTRVISTGTSVWNVGGQYVDVRGFDMTSSNPSATWGIHGQGAYSRYIDNYIHDIYSDSPGAGVMIGGGADYQQVIGNVIARIAHTPGGSTDNQGIYVQENHTTIANNIVFDCAKVGIQIWSGAAAGKPQYNIVSGNTVFGSYRGFDIGAANSSYADNNTITDNIFYGNTDLGMYTATGYQGYVGPHNTIAHNNSHGNATNYYNLTHTNDIVADPLFVDYRSDGSGDYRLQSGSACRDTGTTSGAPSTDFLGVTRPQGSAPDCGAYEYVP